MLLNVLIPHKIIVTTDNFIFLVHGLLPNIADRRIFHTINTMGNSGGLGAAYLFGAYGFTPVLIGSVVLNL